MEDPVKAAIQSGGEHPRASGLAGPHFAGDQTHAVMLGQELQPRLDLIPQADRPAWFGWLANANSRSRAGARYGAAHADEQEAASGDPAGELEHDQGAVDKFGSGSGFGQRRPARRTMFRLAPGRGESAKGGSFIVTAVIASNKNRPSRSRIAGVLDY